MCNLCSNAFVCEDLGHDEDLSYTGLFLADNTLRVFFRSGDKRKTGFIFESYDGAWCPVGSYFPNYCPSCGRELFENKLIKFERPEP